MAKQDPTHEIHTDPSGRYRWTQEHGLMRHDAHWHGADRMGVLADQGGEAVEMPLVVLRCRCGDPDSHAVNNEHCPVAEIDIGESFSQSVTFNPQPTAQP